MVVKQLLLQEQWIRVLLELTRLPTLRQTQQEILEQQQERLL